MCVLFIPSQIASRGELHPIQKLNDSLKINLFSPLPLGFPWVQSWLSSSHTDSLRLRVSFGVTAVCFSVSALFTTIVKEFGAIGLCSPILPRSSRDLALIENEDNLAFTYWLLQYHIRHLFKNKKCCYRLLYMNFYYFLKLNFRLDVISRNDCFHSIHRITAYIGIICLYTKKLVLLFTVGLLSH